MSLMEQKYFGTGGLLMMSIIWQNDIHQVYGCGTEIYLNCRLD